MYLNPNLSGDPTMRTYNHPTRLWLGPYYRKSPFFEATSVR